jgi:NADH-quinone oxidoreductase subunit L
LCSYLLIGFYFLRKSASDAGKKAFIVNRIGDAGFLLGLFLMLGTLGTIQFTEIGPAIAAGICGGRCHADGDCAAALRGRDREVGAASIVCLAAGRDGRADAGQRVDPRRDDGNSRRVHDRAHQRRFSMAPKALAVVAVVGCVTSIFAATMGLVQNDIKRVLAYSTVSQLGYMFLACGVGAFTAGVFHLMTHAFFKALALPRIGQRDPRALRRTGHAQDGRPVDENSHYSARHFL